MPSGIGLEAVSVMAGSLATVALGVASFISSRIDRSRERGDSFLKTEIKTIVDAFASRMRSLEDHLKSQDEHTARNTESIARMQGNLEARGMRGDTGDRGEEGTPGQRGERGERGEPAI